MADVSKIAWTRSTFNGWVGCTKVSPGCDHCYASVSTPTRTLGVQWGAGQPRRRTSESNWRGPLKWNHRAREEANSGKVLPSWERIWNRPGFWPVFCSSLADVFDNEVDPEWRADLFRLIRATPNLTWLLLTKRIGNANSMIAAALSNEDIGHSVEFALWPWPNVWLGATIVDQAEADRDIPKLLAVPAAKRFVSYEPALGLVEWRFAFADLRTACCHVCGFRTNQVGGLCPNDGATLRGDIGLDWIIVGGESDQPGMKARPFDIAWARSTVRQCKAAGVPVFFKQGGSHVIFDGKRMELRNRSGADLSEFPADIQVQEFPNA